MNISNMIISGRLYRTSLETSRNRNRNLQTSKAPLKSTSLFTSAASNQRGCPKNSPWEAQVRLPEGERKQIIGVRASVV